MANYIDINGRKLREPNGARYMLTDKNYKQYLRTIKERLENEVAPYMDCIKKRHDADLEAPVAGFFSLVRMVMPVVDTVATVQGVQPPAILDALGAPAPNLMWNLYRDMLLHNDELMFGSVEGLGIPAGVGITFEGEQYPEIFKTDYRILDVGYLYRELLRYLEEQEAKAPKDKTIRIISGIEYFPSAIDSGVKAILAEIAKGKTNTN